MKNIILTFCSLLILNGSIAQDFSYLLSMDKVAALAFSNKINANVREPWKFVNTDGGSDYLRVNYVPPTTTAEELKKIEDRGLNISGVKYYTVKFKKFQEGEDKELEIEGVTKYEFQSVELKFLDAFNVWEKLFFNGTTIERVRAREDGEIPKVKDSHIKLRFTSSAKPNWKIFLYE